MGLAWQPSAETRASAFAHTLDTLPGAVFSVAVPRTCCTPGPFWWISSALSPHLCASPTSEVVPWAAPLHYALGSFSWSSLAPGLPPSCLPYPWNPALISTFSPHLVPIILPAPKLYSSVSAQTPKQHCSNSSSLLPCLSYHLSQPWTPMQSHWHHTSSQYSRLCASCHFCHCWLNTAFQKPASLLHGSLSFTSRDQHPANGRADDDCAHPKCMIEKGLYLTAILPIFHYLLPCLRARQGIN